MSKPVSQFEDIEAVFRGDGFTEDFWRAAAEKIRAETEEKLRQLREFEEEARKVKIRVGRGGVPGLRAGV